MKTNTKTNFLREACVETYAEIDAAKRAGAGRIELCSSLDQGGFTPDKNMVTYADMRDLPVAAMIRRAPGFSADAEDLEALKADVLAMFSAGARALVFGYVTGNPPRLDLPVLETLKEKMIASIPEAIPDMACFKPVPHLVFHMAFDAIPPEGQFEAIDALAGLGFKRILTKGGPGKAEDNLAHLKELNDYARGKITLVCGGSVTDANYQKIAAATGIEEFHGRKLAAE